KRSIRLLTRWRASNRATTATVMTAARRSPRSVSALCRSRSGARTARRRGRTRSSASGSLRRAAGPLRCSSTCKTRRPNRGSAGGGAPNLPTGVPPNRKERNEVAMRDQLENLKAEDVSIGEKPLSIPSELPILPLRDTVLFPNSFMPLAVARESSVRLIDDAIANGKLIAVFTQRDAAVEEPGQDDLHAVGTATHIHKMFKLPDGSLRPIVQGPSRLNVRS